MSPQELLDNAGIRLPSYAPGNHSTTCPECSAKRSLAHQTTPCLSVKIDGAGATWHCNHCQWSGPSSGIAGNGNGHDRENRFTAIYDYCDEGGELLFQVCRRADKQFPQRRPDGKGGWIWKTGDVRKVLYRLPELIEAIASERTVLIVEGEKDVESLRKLNVPATCNPGGASKPDQHPKWKIEHSEQLRGADIVVLNDHDPPGVAHANAICSMSVGIAKRIRRLVLAEHWRAIPPGGDVSDWLAAGHTREELDALIERAPDYNGQAETPEADGDLDEWDAGDDPGPIPPREWLLANQFCIGYISSLVAAGGTGKSALRLLQYISLAINRSLCGQHVFRRCRVLLISLEDDDREIQRRIKAVLDHHGINRSELKGWLFCKAVKLAKLAELKGKIRSAGPLEHQIRKSMARRKPDLVALDPFVKTHSLEESNSGDMDFVCDLLARMAGEFNIAVDSPHHVHKGQISPGDADAGRGSSGIRDTGRLVYTLTYMSEEEAKLYSIPVENRRLYIRLDSSKVNIVEQSGKPTWFRFIGVPIGNATPQYPNGDTVQTVEPWSPPETWAGISTETLNVILTAIERGTEEGQRYSAGPKTGEARAAWRVVQRHCPDKTEGQCREIIRQWLKTELLVPKEYYDPVQRKDLSGLHVNDSKRPT
jgi:hypothetical protein